MGAKGRKRGASIELDGQRGAFPSPLSTHGYPTLARDFSLTVCVCVDLLGQTKQTRRFRTCSSRNSSHPQSRRPFPLDLPPSLHQQHTHPTPSTLLRQTRFPPLAHGQQRLVRRWVQHPQPSRFPLRRPTGRIGRLSLRLLHQVVNDFSPTPHPVEVPLVLIRLSNPPPISSEAEEEEETSTIPSTQPTPSPPSQQPHKRFSSPPERKPASSPKDRSKSSTHPT